MSGASKQQRLAWRTARHIILLICIYLSTALAPAAFLSLSNGNKSRLGLRAILVAEMRKFGSSYWRQCFLGSMQNLCRRDFEAPAALNPWTQGILPMDAPGPGTKRGRVALYPRVAYPPTSWTTLSGGLKFGHRWVYAGWISTRCGYLK